MEIQTEKIPVLSIGAILGDSNAENMNWSRHINILSNKIQIIREDVTSPVRVNVVFHVDGKIAPNEFLGIRTGRFSKKDSKLMIQAAITLSEVADKDAYLRELLEKSIDEAECYFRKKKIVNELPEIRSILSQI